MIGAPEPGWEAAYRSRSAPDRGEPHARLEALDLLFRSGGVRRVLDLGCGDGRHLRDLLRRGYDTVGIDCAPTALRLARDWIDGEPGRLRLACGDMSRIPLASRSLDAVVAFATIYHQRLASFRRTLREIYRVLRPGGWLFFTAKDRRGRPVDDPARWVPVEPGTWARPKGNEMGVPHRFFHPRDLEAELVGFDILDVEAADRGELRALAQRPAGRP